MAIMLISFSKNISNSNWAFTVEPEFSMAYLNSLGSSSKNICILIRASAFLFSIENALTNKKVAFFVNDFQNNGLRSN